MGVQLLGAGLEFFVLGVKSCQILRIRFPSTGDNTLHSLLHLVGPLLAPIALVHTLHPFPQPLLHFAQPVPNFLTLFDALLHPFGQIFALHIESKLKLAEGLLSLALLGLDGVLKLGQALGVGTYGRRGLVEGGGGEGGVGLFLGGIGVGVEVVGSHQCVCS